MTSQYSKLARFASNPILGARASGYVTEFRPVVNLDGAAYIDADGKMVAFFAKLDVGGDYSIHRAVSSDGLAWTDQGTVIVSQQTGAGHFIGHHRAYIHPNGTWYMFYVDNGFSPNGWMYTTSDDEGLTWEPGDSRWTITSTGESVGYGDGETVYYDLALAANIVPGALAVNYVSGGLAKTAADNGLGDLIADTVIVGSINYESGIGSITFVSIPDAETELSATYNYTIAVHNATALRAPTPEFAEGYSWENPYGDPLFGNTWAMFANGQWSILLERVLFNPEDGSSWCIALVTGASLDNLTAATIPLPGLLFGTPPEPYVLPAGGNGSPHVIKRGGAYHLWFWHANNGNLPGTIWYSKATNLAGPWSTPVLVLDFTTDQDIDGSGESHQDQAVDPTVIEFGGKVFLYFTAANNTASPATSTSNINVATVDGRLKKFLGLVSGGPTGTSPASPLAMIGVG